MPPPAPGSVSFAAELRAHTAMDRAHGTAHAAYIARCLHADARTRTLVTPLLGSDMRAVHLRRGDFPRSVAHSFALLFDAIEFVHDAGYTHAGDVT